jgi:hypothetical protein
MQYNTTVYYFETACRNHSRYSGKRKNIHSHTIFTDMNKVILFVPNSILNHKESGICKQLISTIVSLSIVTK